MDLQSKDIVIGIGSNIQAIENIRSAIKQIRRSHFFDIKKVSRLYESEAQVPNGSPENWNQSYLNIAILVHVKLQSAFDLLSELKKIEQIMGRNLQKERWSPRCIDLDILYIDGVQFETEKLTIPHKELFSRPFAYLPLRDVLPRFEMNEPTWYRKYLISGHSEFSTHVSEKYFLPNIVGILNVTSDSFSDGSKYLNSENFVMHAKKLITQGASILDVGAESTRPGAIPISVDLEYQRLLNSLELLQQIQKEGYDFKISIDCYKSEVLQKIISRFNIDMINSVSGLPNDQILHLVKEKNIKCVVMHSLSVPVKKGEYLPEDSDPVDIIINWWRNVLVRIQNFNISPDKIVFDPGLGFGKNKYQSRYILQNLERFKVINSDFFVGYSRKSFLSYDENRSAEDRDLESVLALQKMNLSYAQYLRVHDVVSAQIGLRTIDGL